jgi:hypothetical protein
LEARLTTLLCKQITVTKSKDVKTRSNLAQSLRKSMAQKVMFSKSDEDDDICSSLSFPYIAFCYLNSTHVNFTLLLATKSVQ